VSCNWEFSSYTCIATKNFHIHVGCNLFFFLITWALQLRSFQLRICCR
jgi:hypothetical protein